MNPIIRTLYIPSMLWQVDEFAVRAIATAYFGVDEVHFNLEARTMTLLMTDPNVLPKVLDLLRDAGYPAIVRPQAPDGPLPSHALAADSEHASLVSRVS